VSDEPILRFAQTYGRLLVDGLITIEEFEDEGGSSSTTADRKVGSAAMILDGDARGAVEQLIASCAKGGHALDSSQREAAHQVAQSWPAHAAQSQRLERRLQAAEDLSDDDAIVELTEIVDGRDPELGPLTDRRAEDLPRLAALRGLVTGARRRRACVRGRPPGHAAAAAIDAVLRAVTDGSKDACGVLLR